MERGLNPIAPFGRQISLSLGWSGVGGKREKGLFFGDLEFPTKPGENLLFYPYHFSVGDCLPGKGSRPPNITNSWKNSTNVLGYPRFKAGLAIGGVFAAENHR